MFLRFLLPLCVCLIPAALMAQEADGGESQGTLEDSLTIDEAFRERVRERQLFEQLAEREARETKRKKKRFKGYGAYKKRLKLFCSYMDRDHRLEDFRSLLVGYTERDDTRDTECPACRPLIKAFDSSCRKKKKKVRPTPTPVEDESATEDEAEEAEEDEEEEVDASPSASPSQSPVPPLPREPRVEVIDLITGFANDTFADEDNRVSHLRAFAFFRDRLRDTDSLSLGSREYFDTLAVYAFAPYAHLEAFAEWEMEQEAQEEQVDSYFFGRRPTKQLLEQVAPRR